MLLLFKRQLPDWKAPWTNKFQNHAKKLPNVSSEILEKQPFSTASVACGCCSKTASKKSPAGGKTLCLWRTNKFQNRAKKLPNVTSETHRKGWFFSYFSPLLLLLLLLLMLLLFKRQLSDWKAPWTNKFQNHAKKLPNVSSEILEKQPFSTASVACGCCSKTASKKSPAGGKTPCLWRTNKFQNRAKKLPNVTSETHRFFLATFSPCCCCCSCSWCSFCSKGSSRIGKRHGRTSSKTTPKNCLMPLLKS